MRKDAEDGVSNRFTRGCDTIVAMLQPVVSALALAMVVARLLGPSSTCAELLLSIMPYEGADPGPAADGDGDGDGGRDGGRGGDGDGHGDGGDGGTSEAGDVALHGTLMNVSLIMSCVVGATLLFALLFRYRCQRTLHWFLSALFAVVYVLAFVGPVAELAGTLHWHIDVITVAVLAAHLCVIGAGAVFWEQLADTFVVEAYSHAFIVFAMVALAWPFMVMPPLTLWLTLAALVVWDLIAVLAPWGPLRYVLELEAKRRLVGEEMTPPGLVYETVSFRLGTGDFLFYAVLVGRAADDGFVPAACCAVCLLAGVALTVVMTFHAPSRTVPALPAALVLGGLGYVAGRFTVAPYVEHLSDVLIMP